MNVIVMKLKFYLFFMFGVCVFCFFFFSFFVWYTALGRFSEALLQFKEETDEKSQSSVNMGQFATNAASAFDIVFANWRVVKKDTTLRLAVAEAIGLLTEIMDPKKFQNNFKPVVDFFLQSIAKEPAANYPPLTNGLCSVLKVMHREDICDKQEDIEKIIDAVMERIHPLAAIKPNYNDKKTLKSHSNVLKSFEYLARSRLTQTLSWLLGKLQSKSSSSRLASLIVLRHFVNSIDDRLGGSKALIISSCHVLLTETDYKVMFCAFRILICVVCKGCKKKRHKKLKEKTRKGEKSGLTRDLTCDN